MFECAGRDWGDVSKLHLPAEKCGTIRWRRQCRVERNGRLKRGRCQEREDRQNWQLTDAIGAHLGIDLSPPISMLAISFGRKLHFVKAFLRLLLTKQREDAWEIAANKPWQAVNMQIVFFETQFNMIYKYFTYVDLPPPPCLLSPQLVQVQVRHFKLLMDLLSSSKFTKNYAIIWKNFNANVVDRTETKLFF